MLLGVYGGLTFSPRGYAMESKCHIGRVCEYKLTGGLDARNHAMQVVLDTIRANESVPACIVEENCTDCSDWSFVSGFSGDEL